MLPSSLRTPWEDLRHDEDPLLAFHSADMAIVARPGCEVPASTLGFVNSAWGWCLAATMTAGACSSIVMVQQIDLSCRSASRCSRWICFANAPSLPVLSVQPWYARSDCLLPEGQEAGSSQLSILPGPHSASAGTIPSRSEGAKQSTSKCKHGKHKRKDGQKSIKQADSQQKGMREQLREERQLREAAERSRQLSLLRGSQPQDDARCAILPVSAPFHRRNS